MLARGTWYIDKQPMLVYPWGTSNKEKIVETIPLWVKPSNIPECYWTQKGLSYLIGTIGSPICADEVTSKSDMVPFAKFCINYNVGDALSDSIEVVVLDPISGGKKTGVVFVTYPSKPWVCTGCHSLGHVAGAFPLSKRTWVQKQTPLPNDAASKDDTPPVVDLGTNSDGVCNDSKVKDSTMDYNINMQEVEPEQPVTTILEDDSAGKWQTATGKRCFSSPVSPTLSDTSPPPLNTFKNLTMVDGIDAKLAGPVGDLDTSSNSKLSDSQRKKKRKKALGRKSPRFT